MSTALAKADPAFDAQQINLIKSSIAVGVSDLELQLFLHTAHRLGLDPFADQIHAIKRWDSRQKREVMKIQVGIAGLRAAADRTGCYAPGPDNVFAYDEKGKVRSSSATVLKFVQGSWHPVTCTAHWDEYVQTNRDGAVTSMWASKPHIMLGKCAEALALRKAFPQLSGVYIPEEMQQGEPEEPQRRPAQERSSPTEGAREVTDITHPPEVAPGSEERWTEYVAMVGALHPGDDAGAKEARLGVFAADMGTMSGRNPGSLYKAKFLSLGAFNQQALIDKRGKKVDDLPSALGGGVREPGEDDDA